MTSSLLYDAPDTYDTPDTYDGAGAPVGWVQLGAGDERIVFNTGPDAEGVEWWLSTLEGWDAPELRKGSTNRPQDHGVFIPSFFHGGRLLEGSGTAVAPTAAAAGDAKNRLAAALNITDRLEQFIVTEELARVVFVRRADPPKIAQRRRLVTFSFMLLAPDYRKHTLASRELTLEAGEAGVAVNAGTTEARPTAIVTGPVDTPTLRNATTGEELTFDVYLEVGETMELDFDLRLASVGGVSVRAALLPGYRWWEIPRGSSTIEFDAASSGGGSSFVVTWRDAWV